ncbi:MAG: DMT family transporter [Holophaga sp.]
MALHQPSGRRWLGLLLTLLTVLFWATQPVAFKIALEQVDPLTMVWVRFAAGGLAIGGWMVWRGDLGTFRGRPAAFWLLLAIAVASLLGNFVFAILGIKWTTPANSQFLFQASHPLVALGAILVFKERFNRWQWLGMGAIVAGLAIFFHDGRAGSLLSGGQHYVLGSAMVLLSALVWPGFALAQKQLLRHLSSIQINGFVYGVLAVAFLPCAKPSVLLGLDGAHWAAVGYCILATVTAYLAFAGAFAHWEASRVASVCSITPVFTVLAVALVHHLAPSLMRPERITLLGWAGGILIVSGSALSSLMRDRVPAGPGGAP